MRRDDRGTVEERFWAKVETTSTCWIWKASYSGNGYGYFYVGPGRSRRAHRVAYELLVGPIPRGLHLDHTCGNRKCVNPQHLDPVTNAENHRRAAERRRATRAACIHGHSFTVENTYVRANGVRVCRRCRADHQRKEGK